MGPDHSGSAHEELFRGNHHQGYIITSKPLSISICIRVDKMHTLYHLDGLDHLCYFCLVLLCFHASLFVDAWWSPAGKGLTSWLSFVMSNCDVVTFPLVSWVRCGA